MHRRRTTRVAACVAVFALLAFANATRAQEQDEPVFRLLARSKSELTDGTERTLEPLITRTVVGLDRSGRALFDGSLSDKAGNIVASKAVLVADDTSLRAVFALGDDAPSNGINTGGSTILLIQDIRYSTSGQVLLNAQLTGGAIFGQVLLTDNAGVQRVQAALATPFPGVCGLNEIGNGSHLGQFALNGDHLVFHFINSMDLCGNNLRGVAHSVSDGAPTVVAIEEGPVPGRATEVFDHIFVGPSLNEDGEYLFVGRYELAGTGVIQTLLLSVPGAGLSTVASTMTQVPGTADVITGFHLFRVGRTPSGESTPRVVYAVDTAVSVHVIDTVHGAEPILSNGDTVEGFTLDTLAIGVAIANDDTAVIVGDTTGPGIPAGGEAVWRMDTRSTPNMRVALHEGGPIPGDDPRAAGRTISRLLTVNLNEDGRLVVECELTPGGQAILIEEKGALNAGSFRIAVLNHDTLPTFPGTGEVFGLLASFPSFPAVHGPGDDSLQTRFNGAGQFVFRARIDPDDGSPNFTALYTVSLDLPPEECDVTVKQKGRNLSITGGKGDCTFTVWSDADGDFRVIPNAPTTVNESATTFSVSGVTGSIRIKLGRGDDDVTLASTNTAGDRDSIADVFKNLFIDTGAGFDVLRMTEFQIDGSLAIKTGSGGKDTVLVSDSYVARNLRFAGGLQEAFVQFLSCDVEGKTALKMSGGPAPDSPPGDLEFVVCGLGHTKIKGNRAGDDIDIDRCVLVGNLKIDSGGGIIDQVRLNAVRFEPGTISIKASKSDTLILRMNDCEVDDGGMRVNTGSGGCDLLVDKCDFLRDVRIKTGDSRGDARINKIAVTNSFFESALVIKGNGSHDIFVGAQSEVDGGIVVNTKGGILDLVGVSSTKIRQGGHLSVTSKAAAFQGRFHTNQFLDGNLSVRGTRGTDKVFMTESVIAGNVFISLSGGDDLLDMETTEIAGNLRLFGGSGTDAVKIDAVTRSNVEGETVEDSFEIP